MQEINNVVLLDSRFEKIKTEVDDLELEDILYIWNWLGVDEDTRSFMAKCFFENNTTYQVLESIKHNFEKIVDLPEFVEEVSEFLKGIYRKPILDCKIFANAIILDIDIYGYSNSLYRKIFREKVSSGNCFLREFGFLFYIDVNRLEVDILISDVLSKFDKETIIQNLIEHPLQYKPGNIYFKLLSISMKTRFFKINKTLVKKNCIAVIQAIHEVRHNKGISPIDFVNLIYVYSEPVLSIDRNGISLNSCVSIEDITQAIDCVSTNNSKVRRVERQKLNQIKHNLEYCAQMHNIWKNDPGKYYKKAYQLNDLKGLICSK